MVNMLGMLCNSFDVVEAAFSQTGRIIHSHMGLYLSQGQLPIFMLMVYTFTLYTNIIFIHYTVAYDFGIL